MEVVCCIKSVPNIADEEVQIVHQRVSVGTYPRCLNDWDRYVLEEALRLTELQGGSITALTFGGSASEDVLRRAMALGADEAVMLTGSLEEEPRRVAAALASVIRARHFDLVLTGAQSSDRQGAEVGGMLAAILGLPFASVVVGVERKEDIVLVYREIEGGELEVYEVELPAVLSLQTGINTPRYVSMRGIRKAATKAITVATPDATPNVAVRLVEHRHPPTAVGARMLRGDLKAIAVEVAGIIRERGGLQ
jgi:electron transfer flavoprotein beta subunit